MLNKIIFIMGVSSSGKSTIGKILSDETRLPFFDGDEFHPPENINKMKAGRPLNDDDRETWLKTLNLLALKEINNKGAIIACSALKQKYRDLLKADLKDDYLFVFLKGDINTIKKRMKKRTEHFMPLELLQTQFDDLEVPDNAMDTLIIPITQSPLQICQSLIQRLK